MSCVSSPQERNWRLVLRRTRTAKAVSHGVVGTVKEQVLGRRYATSLDSTPVMRFLLLLLCTFLASSVVATALLRGSLIAATFLAGTFIAATFLGSTLLAGSVVASAFLASSLVAAALLTGSLISASLLAGSVVTTALLAGTLLTCVVALLAGVGLLRGTVAHSSSKKLKRGGWLDAEKQKSADSGRSKQETSWRSIHHSSPYQCGACLGTDQSCGVVPLEYMARCAGFAGGLGFPAQEHRRHSRKLIEGFQWFAYPLPSDRLASNAAPTKSRTRSTARNTNSVSGLPSAIPATPCYAQHDYQSAR